MAEELAPLHLSPRAAASILLVAEAARARMAATPVGVADALGVDRASGSAMIGRLVRSRWLRSEPNPADGRSRILTLAARAEEHLPQIRQAAERVSATAVADFSVGEVAALKDLLARAVANLEAQGSPPRSGRR